ncbi:MAG TPA: metallopeptidase TldD-related protein [Tepidiformaceae bacterium]|nr:metallopeptidase TldD-related protein [Tepidiformaceae bacterium]
MTDPGAKAIAFFNDRYRIDPTAMSSLLSIALSRGGDFAELFFEHRTNSAIQWEDQRVKSASRNVSQGVGIRVVKGDAIGYAYTESLDMEAMRRAAETASRIGTADERPVPVDATPYLAGEGSFYRFDEPLTDEPATAKVALLERADRAARGFDNSIVRLDASIGDEMKYIMVARSDGKVVGDVQPLIRFNVSALSEKGESRQVARTGGGGRLGIEYFSDVTTPEQLASEAARQAVLQQDAMEAPAGTLPVVLAAGDSGVLLHEAVGHGLEADFNRKGTSNYTGRVGQSVASDLVTVVDDGTIADSRGSINVDDEGNPTTRNTLIENGKLRGYLHDEVSSRHFGVAPSGSGRRQTFKDYIMPRMTNTFMLPGQDTKEEIIRSVDRGIYAISYSGGQVNISNGDFVFSVTEAYMIEGGKVTSPLKNVMLIGNGPDVLSKVTKVANDYELSDGRWTCGKDGQSVPVGVGMPTVLVSGITVGGTKV